MINVEWWANQPVTYPVLMIFIILKFRFITLWLLFRNIHLLILGLAAIVLQRQEIHARDVDFELGEGFTSRLEISVFN